MLPKRVIPCLDIDKGRVVKGVEFTDMQEVGDPAVMAQGYEAAGADELVFLDTTATLASRAILTDIVRRTAANVFIPFTVGGGVRSVADAQALLEAGADKVAVNSAALADPELLNQLASRFGRQCVVAAIDAKRDDRGGWEVYAAGGRSATGRQALAWASETVQRGAGEVLLTSIDRDGTQTGYDLDLTRALTKVLRVPVIASGGAGELEHFSQAINDGGAEAVLAASQFHTGQMGIAAVKASLSAQGIPIRPTGADAEYPVEQLQTTATSPNIAIVDYGVGNHYSIQKALERVGARVTKTGDARELAGSDGIVLPGVGAFQPAMQRLQEDGVAEIVQLQAAAGKPILGVCLGEQLLFDGSYEAGWRAGLGLLRGTVQEITMPIRPNIGWREVSVKRRNPLTDTLPQNSYLYHLHGYAAHAEAVTDVAAVTHLPHVEAPAYEIPSLVRRQDVYGVQFHPEKSGRAGLEILRRFVGVCALANNK